MCAASELISPAALQCILLTVQYSHGLMELCRLFGMMVNCDDDNNFVVNVEWLFVFLLDIFRANQGTIPYTVPQLYLTD